jgi:hypothetical protein
VVGSWLEGIANVGVGVSGRFDEVGDEHFYISWHFLREIRENLTLLHLLALSEGDS